MGDGTPTWGWGHWGADLRQISESMNIFCICDIGGENALICHEFLWFCRKAVVKACHKTSLSSAKNSSWSNMFKTNSNQVLILQFGFGMCSWKMSVFEARLTVTPPPKVPEQ